MKYSACIDSLYMDHCSTAEELRMCLSEVREAGLDTIEFWSWWDKDLDAMESVLREYGMKVSTFCTKFISLTDPSQRNAYIQGLRESIKVAKRFGCTRLISQTGQYDVSVPRRVQFDSIVDGLKECVPILEEAGVILMVEPVNEEGPGSVPNYYLQKSPEAYAIIEAVGSRYVTILYDIFSQQLVEGNIINNIKAGFRYIAHYHLASTPDHNEPYKGELNFPIVIQAIRSMGYDGYLGLEYDPTVSLKECVSEIGHWII